MKILLILSIAISLFAVTCKKADISDTPLLAKTFQTVGILICIDKSQDEIIAHYNSPLGRSIFVDESEWALSNDHKILANIYSSKHLYLKDCCLP